MADRTSSFSFTAFFDYRTSDGFPPFLNDQNDCFNFLEDCLKSLPGQLRTALYHCTFHQILVIS